MKFMFKKLLFAILFLGTSFTAFSQLTFSPDSSYAQMVPGVYTKCSITVTNSGNHDVMVSWKMINSTLKDYGNPGGAWGIGYCDCVQCYFNDFSLLIQQDSCPDPMAPGESIEWYITVDPGTVAMDNAEWIVEVHNYTDDIKDTISYFLLDHPNSIEKVNQSADVKSYPNPAKNELIVDYSLTNVNNPVLSVYSLLGSKVASFPINEVNGRLNVNTSAYETGMYFYTIEENGQRVFIQKFNVVH